MLDDEDDRHVNDAYPVYAPMLIRVGLVRATEGRTREVDVSDIDMYTLYL